MTDYRKYPSDNELEEIVESFYHYVSTGKQSDNVKIDSGYEQIDNCNYIYSGTILCADDKLQYNFIIRDGNIAGTEVEEWGSPEEVGHYYREPEPEVEELDFIPIDESISTVSKVFLNYIRFRWTSRFKLLLKCYRTLLPPVIGESMSEREIKNHYIEQAKEYGLKTGYISLLTADKRILISSLKTENDITNFLLESL